MEYLGANVRKIATYTNATTVILNLKQLHTTILDGDLN
jgi:hypothetical protein